MFDRLSALDRRAKLLRFFGQIGRDLNDWRIPYIIAFRHGFNPFDPDSVDLTSEPMRQAEVAEWIGISASRAYQLEAQALDYIRENYNEDFREIYAEATQ